MGTTKLLNLLAISSLAIISSSFLAAPVNALSTHHDLLARQPIHAHGAIAKRKRSNGKRCKARTSSAKASSSTANVKTDTSKSDKNDDNKKDDKDDGGNKGDNKDDNKDSDNNSGGGGGGGVSSYGKKVGIAWPNGDDDVLKYWKTDKTGPLYTWSPYVTPLAKKYGFEPVPMFWGPKDANDFKRLVVKGYASHVLGFNEPNQDGQSDINPQYGAQLWKQYIDPLKHQGYTLVSPATTSAPSGKKWMQDFFKACDGCTVDIVAIHYYDVSAQGFIDYINDFHDTFHKNIWVTEWACQNFNGGAQKNQGEVADFLRKTTDYMDSVDWVEHYFWFGIMHDMQNVNPDNQLMASNGRPNSLGNEYIHG